VNADSILSLVLAAMTVICIVVYERNDRQLRSYIRRLERELSKLKN
jgi:hypothetical protein